MGSASARADRRPFLEKPGFGLWIFATAATGSHAWWLLTPGTAYGNVPVVHVLALSLVTFLVFAWDKLLARRSRRRVSEVNLLILSLAGGALGGLAALSVFRHKSRRTSFRVILPVAFFLQLVFVIVLAHVD